MKQRRRPTNPMRPANSSLVSPNKRKAMELASRAEHETGNRREMLIQEATRRAR